MGLLLNEPPSSAECLGAHIGGDEFAASDPPGATQKICQAMGHTRGCVTSPLLRRNTKKKKILSGFIYKEIKLNQINFQSFMIDPFMQM